MNKEKIIINVIFGDMKKSDLDDYAVYCQNSGLCGKCGIDCHLNPCWKVPNPKRCN